MPDDHPSRPDRAALWLGVLLRRFPELARELAPSRTTSPSPTGRSPRSEAALPIRLFVSDTIRDITDGVIELDEAVHEKLRLPRPGRARVEERLLRLLGLLDRIAGHPLLAAHVTDEARRMAERCAVALGEPDVLVRVRGRCEFCGSVSLRVFTRAETVLCVNPACRCSDPSCPCRTDSRHRHTWVRADWERRADPAGTGEEGTR
ncbi:MULTISPECIES: hypothetical protein [Streptomyces]|uniref:hypothetical protein n=1 Tax=Streptomyces TaxID=1883 RepID=UPI00163C9FDA|nr:MULTISPECIES: hypothetical protein [Streptomyces]MBC2877451.1 hypothetical protein [Streptomyces sp. TYQ1024]UBI38249.1 hypothetical protein K7I03_18505 [Streptomyces mobaraensis]UKW30835.1 hypothetical protein MCU78_18465 [Streptomyces sp. TYQ1024]